MVSAAPGLLPLRPAQARPRDLTTPRGRDLVERLLQEAAKTGIPPEALGFAVAERRIEDDGGVGPPRFWAAHQPDQPFNPASVAKTLTAWAALEVYGPDHAFTTELALGGSQRGGRLQGDLILRGGGDPGLRAEDLRAWIQQLRGQGLRRLEGRLWVDGSRFAEPLADPGLFDGEPLKPYNAPPHAALSNLNAVELLRDGNTWRLEPPLMGLRLDDRTEGRSGGCAQASLRVEQQPSAGLQLSGRWPRLCQPAGAVRLLAPLADPGEFTARLFAALWTEQGGEFAMDFSGSWTRGPEGLALLSQWRGRPLAEWLPDILAKSNNPMTRTLFLNLSRDLGGPGTRADAAEQLRSLLARRGLYLNSLVQDNGSGLSRLDRIAAAEMTQLLSLGPTRLPWGDWVASFAEVGVSGTARRWKGAGAALGRSWVKTGSLQGVRSMAGMLQSRSGAWHCFTLLANHPEAPAARSLFEFCLHLIAEQADSM